MVILVILVILWIVAFALLAWLLLFVVCEHGPVDRNVVDSWLNDHAPLPIPPAADVDPIPERLKECIDGRCEYCDAHVVEDEDGHLIPITLTLIQVRERIAAPFAKTRLEACGKCLSMLPHGTWRRAE